MSLLGYLLIHLSFSLPRLIAAMPGEGPALATTPAPQPLEPRQTDRADFVGWISDGSTYSPQYCASGKIFCTVPVSSSSTFIGCGLKTGGSRCPAPSRCIGTSTVVYDRTQTACPAGHKCYTGTLYPAAISTGGPMYFEDCYRNPPPVYFRAEPTSGETPSPSGLSTGAKIGIAVGASVGGSSIIIIVIIWWRRRGHRISNITKITGDGNRVGQGIGMGMAMRRLRRVT